jgi:hypothetical protein
MDNENTPKMASFLLTEEHNILLAEIAYQDRMNKSEMIRHLIDAEAKRQGISIGPDGIAIKEI